jgi:hypothetical protein
MTVTASCSRTLGTVPAARKYSSPRSTSNCHCGGEGESGECRVDDRPGAMGAVELVIQEEAAAVVYRFRHW